MRVPEEGNVSLKVVGEGVGAADDWIVSHLEADDIVLAADVPLAARGLRLGFKDFEFQVFYRSEMFCIAGD
jgi:uncharacterized protein YaiI (UPF0178 family)